MKVAMLLADYAEVVNGKLYIMGGGWSVTGPVPMPSAVAVKVEVPWTAANQKHLLKLELLDADSKPVLIPIDGEEIKPVKIETTFEIGRAPGIIPGSPLDVPFAINIPPLPLELGRRYVWRLSINNENLPDWQLAFSTRAPSPAALAR